MGAGSPNPSTSCVMARPAGRRRHRLDRALPADREEFDAVAREFGLHELAVEDAVNAHQRPKLERYGDTLFFVLRPARYIDETETVEFGEVHVFAGPTS